MILWPLVLTGSCLLLQVNADAFFVNLGGGVAPAVPLRADRYSPPRALSSAPAAASSAYQKRPPQRSPKAYGSLPPPQQQAAPAAAGYSAVKPLPQKPLKPGKLALPQQQQYTKKPVYPVKLQQVYPQRPLHPQKPVPAAAYGKPYQPAARPLRPTNGLKLDYSGWTPIDFDDSLPGSGGANGYRQEVPDVVTVDVAIANAPAAQTDDFPSSAFTAAAYSQPAPEPITAEDPLLLPPPPPPSVAPLGPSRPVQVPSTYGAPVPAVPYIPSTADLPVYSVAPAAPASPRPVYAPVIQSASPAPYSPPTATSQPAPTSAPAYSPVLQAVVTAAPSPAPTIRAPSSLYGAPGAAYAQPVNKTPAISSLYNVPPREPTKAPVVLPAFTPAPPPADGGLQSYDTSFLVGGRSNFPIVSLLPAESQQQQQQDEDEKFLSFTLDQEYQNTGDPASLAQDAASGSVYVQQPQQGANDLNDELYYIYYQDPDQDPDFGARSKPVRAAAALPSRSNAVAGPLVQRAELRAVAPAPDLPLYDYEETGLGAEVVREVRQPEEEEAPVVSQPVSALARYRPLSGTSSVSFNLNVGGRTSGFSYNL